MPARRLAAAATLACLAPAHAGDFLVVPTDYPTIQAAINAASDLDEILILSGTYAEKFDTLGKAIVISGVAAGTTIDATGLPPGAVATLGNAGDVTLFGQQLPQLNNLTIRDSVAPLGGAVLVSTGAQASLNRVTLVDNTASSGGAVAVGFDAELTIINSTITSNEATNDGGAILAFNGSAVIVNDSLLSFNEADDDGGAIHSIAATVLINDSDLVNNTAASRGGAVSAADGAVESRDTVWRANTAFRGGAAYISNAALRSARDRFVQNSADRTPAIFVVGEGDRADLLMVNTRVQDNETIGPISNVSQGAVHLRTLAPDSSVGALVSGCLFASNDTFAAITVGDITTPNIPVTCDIINTTIADNSNWGVVCTSGPLVRLRNSIVWDNPSGGLVADVAARTVTSYSIFPETALYPGAGNINQNPMLSSGDEIPRLGSPAIDAGRLSDLPSDFLDLDDDGSVISEDQPTDILGAPRVIDDQIVPNTGSGSPCIDIGAFESQRDCAADYSGDGVYDFNDTLDFLSRFSAGDPLADVAPAFGALDFNDVLAFLTAFSDGCP